MKLLALKAAVRCWPFANGSGRLIDKFGRGILLGSSEATLRTSDGFPISVYLHDHIGRHIAISGAFDRSPVQALLAHCRPGDQCLDIGANIGYVACLLLHNVSGSRVFCVEPQPNVSTLLRKNLERFPRERWDLLEAALSDSAGQGFLRLDMINRGASSLVNEAGSDTLTVPMIPASELLDRFERLDIIKIDIEGHEEPVFRSMEGNLRRLRPRAILFEDQKAKASPDGPIGSILKRNGYRIYGIDKRLLKTALVEIHSTAECRFNDYLAVRSE